MHDTSSHHQCYVLCRAVAYNFPLLSDASSTKADAAASAKQGTQESPAAGAGAVPGPAQTQLCLLVDVTASKLKRVGRYQLGRVVGRGSFGVVRLGQNTQTGPTDFHLNPILQLEVHAEMYILGSASALLWGLFVLLVPIFPCYDARETVAQIRGCIWLSVLLHTFLLALLSLALMMS